MIRPLPVVFKPHLFTGLQTVKYGRSLFLRRISTEPQSPKKTPTILSSIYTIPNVLTLSRIAAAPLIGHCIISNNVIPALGLFTYSCLTDFLDGYMARKYNMKSVAGTVLDPMADKILMLVTTASLAFPGGPQIIPLPLASLIIGRDAILGFSAIYFRIASLKYTYGKVSWNSFWDVFRFPSAEVRPTQISKWNTFLQMIYLGWAVTLMVVESNPEEEESSHSNMDLYRKAFEYFGYLVATTTVLSGTSYIFSKNAVKYLNKIK
ncbi:LANO_0E01948g1_1 [Lachancea nothofagi CBS 11611]|uniref:LANO_0E01948g1_1 n=1 Tax=Lachancea nothofagi CBS 11611 TaxID=1266666 RepID=A0A1G4JPQ3_9SACH|nr:LANO_0E01948g1_1 [Lachancea nothofagi CBS 11611]